MNIGKQIKALRLQKSVTQEKLAQLLGVSPQAVSKWENDVTMPDIQLLPELSAYLGATIDELFQVTDEVHLNRIENMIYDRKVLSQADYEYAEHFLQIHSRAEGSNGKCLRLLAQLHLQKARHHREQAEFYAKAALEADPSCKANHVALKEAQGGTETDWNLANHFRRISYYYDFIHKNPDDARGYMYLMDELIADGRLEEADALIGPLSRTAAPCRLMMYEGEISWARGDHDQAFHIWERMCKEDSDNWLVYAYLGDRLARDSRYEEAVRSYEKAFSLQPLPRYVDQPECIAHICEINGQYEKAIRYWEEVVRVLVEEWKVAEGEAVDRPKREINRLREKTGKPVSAAAV